MKYPKYFQKMYKRLGSGKTAVWICILLNISVLIYLVYSHCYERQIAGQDTKRSIEPPIQESPSIAIVDVQSRYPYGNGQVWPPDVLNNQYAQPLRDTNYVKMALPMVPTNIGYVNTSYRQVGVLGQHHTNHVRSEDHNHHSQDLLILMGRPLYVNRNKWQYYAISNQRNGVKLTVFVNRKPATNEYGVDELYTNDTVSVQGYRTIYRVELYENDYITYVP
jgi:hypothetical protein